MVFRKVIFGESFPRRSPAIFTNVINILFSTKREIEILKYKSTKHYLLLILDNGYLTHEVCAPHTIPRARNRQG